MSRYDTKICYLAYSNYVLKHYWKYLKDDFSYVWSISQPPILAELKEEKIPDDLIHYRDSVISSQSPRLLKRIANFIFSNLLKRPHEIERKLIEQTKVDAWISDSTLPLLRHQIRQPVDGSDQRKAGQGFGYKNGHDE